MLELKHLSKIYNKQKPSKCYGYLGFILDKKYKIFIFTMDRGLNFLASIESRNYITGFCTDVEFTKYYTSELDAIKGINEYLTKNKII